MDVTEPASLAALTACFILLASAIWAHYRFASYDRLPSQFGLTFKPNAYAPSWMMIWLLPAILIAILALIAFLPAFVPPEHTNGDPAHGVMIASAVVVGAQAFTMWLLTRWAKGQG